MTAKSFTVVATLCIALGTAALTQDAPPGEIFGRTLMMKTADGTGTGTVFSIDHNGKIYLVTARHVVAGLPTKDTKIQIMQSGAWQDYHIAKVLFPESNDVDIAVLETDEKAEKPYGVAIANAMDRESTDQGPTFGQQVWFIGYPWGLHSRLRNGEIPFIKRGTLSAVDATNPKAVTIYIDGFNNPGFSGGPIVYWDFKSHAYRLIGVVQGYRPDNATVIVNGQPVPTPLIVNSGILVGFSIRHAIEAIEQDSKR